MPRLLASERMDVYALLRLALGTEELPNMERDERGKPFFPDRPDRCFNLSHSGNYAMCGLSHQKIGVDIETICPRRTLLVQRTLSPFEYQWYEARGSRWADFYSLWTLKEARVKQSGRGLDRAARTIAVPLLEPGKTGTLDGLRFTAYGGEHWRAAMCAAAETAPLEWA